VHPAIRDIDILPPRSFGIEDVPELVPADLGAVELPSVVLRLIPPDASTIASGHHEVAGRTSSTRWPGEYSGNKKIHATVSKSPIKRGGRPPVER
jgi:hypothetical protein